MEKYLADTTVLVDHLRGIIGAKNFLEQSSVYISHVTIAELIEGTTRKLLLAGVESVICDLSILPLNQTISSAALELMKKFFHSHHLEYLDALIAATALQEHLTLVTANRKHFSFIKELSVIDWKKIQEAK